MNNIIREKNKLIKSGKDNASGIHIIKSDDKFIIYKNIIIYNNA